MVVAHSIREMDYGRIHLEITTLRDVFRPKDANGRIGSYALKTETELN